MLFGEILVAHKFAQVEQLEEALAYQRDHGGRVGEILVALGHMTAEGLNAALNLVPQAPRTLADVGVDPNRVLRLMLKGMLVNNDETPSRMRETLKLPSQVIAELIQDATQKKLIEAMGVASIRVNSEMRYALSSHGRAWASEALALSQYVGPCPVSLERYTKQIYAQRLSNERIDKQAIHDAFANLVTPEWLVDRLGPAVNSMHSMLLYGAAGNGKTTIAERVARMFKHLIYVPYVIEVEGQVIKVFDPSVHRRFEPSPRIGPVGGAANRGVRREEIDARYAPCHRPIVMTGGELTLEMLDLKYSPDAGFYEAPLHMKALNGTFIIDDFGRQMVSPEDLLNRWIVPLESRFDFLKLHTGKSFQTPFDELVVFSTNLEPRDLMDPAFLRRIPYKMRVPSPSRTDFRKIFELVAKGDGIDLTDDAYNMVLHELTEANDYPLATYQPKFIVNQVAAACKFTGERPVFTPKLIADALANLYVRSD